MFNERFLIPVIQKWEGNNWSELFGHLLDYGIKIFAGVDLSCFLVLYQGGFDDCGRTRNRIDEFSSLHLFNIKIHNKFICFFEPEHHFLPLE